MPISNIPAILCNWVGLVWTISCRKHNMLTNITEWTYLSLLVAESISNLRGVGWCFFLYWNSNRTFCEQTVETLICVLRRLIWVCAVCLCPPPPKKKGARLIWVKSNLWMFNIHVLGNLTLNTLWTHTVWYVPGFFFICSIIDTFSTAKSFFPTLDSRCRCT